MIYKLSKSPILIAISCSIFLSIIAIYFNPILGRDSAFYVDIVHQIKINGMTSAFDQFNWPWLPLIITTTHYITSLSPVHSAYLVMIILAAGTCAVLTRTAQMYGTRAGWWGCLISLSLPAYNTYRDSILREPGFWFFTALTIYLISAWYKNNKSLYILLALPAVIFAMAFRLEALFLVPALLVALLCSSHHHFFKYKISILLAISAFSVGCVIVGILFSFETLDNSRINYYALLLDPSALTAALERSAQALSESVLEKYSKDDAATILLFGYVGLILLKTLALTGPFLIPLMLTPARENTHTGKAVLAFLATAVAIYFLVILVFLIQQSFIINRYLAELHILAFPLIALSAVQFQKRFPRAAYILAIIAILTALSNVVSLSPKRTHYIEAGNWISENIPSEKRTFYSEGRVSFYAGRGYNNIAITDKEALTSYFEEFDFFVIEDPEIIESSDEILDQGRLAVIAQFDNNHNRRMIILKKLGNPPL